MNYFYYVNSAYQLLNVINLNDHRKNDHFENIEDYHADLYILNTFKGAENLYEKIKDKGYFDNIYMIEKKVNKGRLHSLYSLLDCLSPSFYFKSKYGFSKEELRTRYDVICPPKYSVFVDQMCRMNKNAEIELFEEGLASYHPLDLLKRIPSIYKKADKILHNLTDMKAYKRLYLVDKSMYIRENPERVVEIPKYRKELLNELCELFSDLNSTEQKKIYWICQFLNNREFLEMLDVLLGKLNKYHDDVLFCQHPRQHMDNKYGFDENDGSHIWELKLLNIKDIDKKLLISVHSTACFSPKMLFDMEPYVLFYYRLGTQEATQVVPSFEKMVEDFRNSYRDPEKVMVPSTMEELEECLEVYYRKVNEL